MAPIRVIAEDTEENRARVTEDLDVDVAFGEFDTELILTIKPRVPSHPKIEWKFDNEMELDLLSHMGRAAKRILKNRKKGQG